MANNRAEIYFFNHYCVNIVQTIFSLGAEFVCYGRNRAERYSDRQREKGEKG